MAVEVVPKIKANFSRYQSWESKQMSTMERAISDIQFIFKTMDFRGPGSSVNRQNQPKCSVQKPSNTKSCCQQRHDQRYTKVVIEKLNDLFDFQHCLKGSLPPTTASAPGTVRNTSAEKSRNYAHVTTQAHSSNSDSDESFLPLESSISLNSNVLGIPPPTLDDIVPLANHANTKGPPMGPTFLKKENHLLLHDLLSGDIYED